MEKEIVEFIEKNNLREYAKNIPKEELLFLRNMVKMNLIREDKNLTEQRIRTVKVCLNQNYNFLDYAVSFRMGVETNFVGTLHENKKLENLTMCEFCKCKTCYKREVVVLNEKIKNYKEKEKINIDLLELLNYLLEIKKQEFLKRPNNLFFKNIDLIELLYIQIILEMDFISVSVNSENEKEIEINYIDLWEKENEDYYINKIINFYKEKKDKKNKIIINIDNLKDIFNEKDKKTRVYKIAGYYKYLIENEKVDILSKLREMLEPKATRNGMTIRSYYFINKHFSKVEELPYTEKTKNNIKNILNYILNYRYQKTTPYVPINILVYSDDKEGIEKINQIIGEFMWFFGYLPESMRYYNESINNIILDKFAIKSLYYLKDKRKEGMLLINNFENLLYTEIKQKNLILNILADEMEKNNSRVCTVIYGKKEIIKKIIGNHIKLSQSLINLELEMEDLDESQIYDLIIKKLEKYTKVSKEVKEKILNYINATYKQSDIQNMEYMNKLYNLIILNINKEFKRGENQELTVDNIPEAYNTKDLPAVMKNINELVGLKEIKDQINDLVCLLKFNKKANIDIKDFNLHMIFSGNPGTGKTTVGRLITEIFYNLGYIKQNKLTEVTAKDLIAEYVGQTSGKTYNVVKSALGGVLFIDEAYALTMGEGRSVQFGNESIATLLKLMEDYRDKLIIIFAGYEEEMQEFVKANPGLVSRIGYIINFPDFSIDELKEIYLNLLKNNNLTIKKDAINEFENVIKEASKAKDFGNARYINNAFQKILIEHAKNIEKSKKEKELYVISKQDINKEKLINKNESRKIGF